MVDEKDRQIILILSKNARTPFTEIGKKLGFSEATVRKRVDALEKERVILKYCVETDPKKMGFCCVSIVGVDVEPPEFLNAAKKLCEFSEVKNVYTSTGDHMIMCEVWAEDGRVLSNFVSEKLGKIAGVKKICPAILLEKLK